MRPIGSIIKDGTLLAALVSYKIPYEVYPQVPVYQCLCILTKFFLAVITSAGGYDEPMEKTSNPYLYDHYSNHELITFDRVNICFSQKHSY